MLRAMTTSKLSVRGIERKTARVLSAGHTETISNSIMLVSALVLALEVSLLCSPDHAALMQSDVRHLLYIKAVQGIGEYEERMPKEDSLGLFGSSLFPSSFFLRRAYFAIVCHLAAICIGCGLHLAILFFRAQQIEDTNTLKLSKTFFVWTIALMLALMFAGNVGFFLLVTAYVEVVWPRYASLETAYSHSTQKMVEIAYNTNRGMGIEAASWSYTATGLALMTLGIVIPMSVACCYTRRFTQMRKDERRCRDEASATTISPPPLSAEEA